MQTKVIGFKSIIGLRNKSRYIANPLHRNHRGKLVTSRWFGCGGETEFLVAAQQVKLGDGRVRRGPKITNCGWEFEMRTPWKHRARSQDTPVEPVLSADETDLINNRIASELYLKMGRVGIHYDRKKGCLDTHVTTINSDLFGEPLSSRRRGNLLRRFRTIMDKVHDEINLARLNSNRPRIPTMGEIRGEFRYKHRTTLIERLAESEMTLDRESIRQFLEASGMLGKRCRIKGNDGDYVTVRYDPERQPRRELFVELIAHTQEKRRVMLQQKKAEAAADVLAVELIRQQRNARQQN